MFPTFPSFSVRKNYSSASREVINQHVSENFIHATNTKDLNRLSFMPPKIVQISEEYAEYFPGSYQFTLQQGITYNITLCGPGGGGGGSISNSVYNFTYSADAYGGGGGGGGLYVNFTVTPSVTKNYTIIVGSKGISGQNTGGLERNNLIRKGADGGDTKMMDDTSVVIIAGGGKGGWCNYISTDVNIVNLSGGNGGTLVNNSSFNILSSYSYGGGGGGYASYHSPTSSMLNGGIGTKFQSLGGDGVDGQSNFGGNGAGGVGGNGTFAYTLVPWPLISTQVPANGGDGGGGGGCGNNHGGAAGTKYGAPTVYNGSLGENGSKGGNPGCGGGGGCGLPRGQDSYWNGGGITIPGGCGGDGYNGGFYIKVV